jgi:chitodextrinase
MRLSTSCGWVAARRAAVCAGLLAAAACGGGGGGGSLPETMKLTATAVSSTAIDVAWTPAAAAPTRYELYANGVYSGSSYTSTHVTPTGLSPNTRYCFVVYAVYFPFGATERSNEGCATTANDLPPAAPAGVRAVVISPTRIDLAWTAADDDWGVNEYRLLRDNVLLATVAATAYSDASVVPATGYCYTVTAVDVVGQSSPPSTAACAATPADAESPSTPTGLDAAAQGTTVTLTWNASTDNGSVASYRIYRDGALVQTMPATQSTPVQATDANLAAYTQYCYRVDAVDRAGNASAPSNRACTTTSWLRSVIVAAPSSFDTVGERNALAIDTAGKLHVAYSSQSWRPDTRDYGPAELRYASNATGAWSSMPVAASFAAQYRAAIAVDASARAHVGYLDPVNSFAQYALLSGSWITESIAAEGAIGLGLALAGGSVPHVVYGRSAGMRHAVKAAGAWSLADVPGVPSSREPALAIDAGGRMHAVFIEPVSQTLRYATDAGGTWSTASIEPANAAGWHFAAAALDRNGALHASYYDGTLRNLKYASNRSGTWTAVVVDSADGAGIRTSIATDAAGAAHVSYVDLTAGRLKYATNAGGVWRSFDLDAAGVGPSGWGDTSIGIDGGGRIHIVYFAGASLRLATRP